MLRRETCLQLDAFMATQQADILEHERYHIPRLSHACAPSKSAYACIMEPGLELNGQTKAVLTEAECRIMSHKLLQCDPNKVWTKNHLPFPIRATEESHRQEAAKAAIQPQQVLTQQAVGQTETKQQEMQEE